MRIHYNSPVVLTFSLLCVLILIVNGFMPKFIDTFFVNWGRFSFGNPLDYLRLFSHCLGHSGWAHLSGNLMMILLVGPLLEEKYGSRRLLIMIIVTAGITGAANNIFFSTGVTGASGIVFLFVILASLSQIRDGSIPLTFILVGLIFMSGEVMGSMKADNISQFAHIMGGLMGSFLGFNVKPRYQTKEL